MIRGVKANHQLINELRGAMNLRKTLLIALGLAVGFCTQGEDFGVSVDLSDRLNYFVREKFVSFGADSNASAVAYVQYKEHNNAQAQRIEVLAKKLPPNTTYSLLARVRAETNYAEAIQFTTNTKGSARVRLNASRSNQGVTNSTLPGVLDPVIALEAIAIADMNTQIVMQADLVSPDKLQYSLKRWVFGDFFPTNTAFGRLSIKGTMKETQFHLKADLAPISNYWLAINGSIVQTNTTDASGALRINALAQPVVSPLDIRKVELLDTSSNVLLSAQLP